MPSAAPIEGLSASLAFLAPLITDPVRLISIGLVFDEAHPASATPALVVVCQTRLAGSMNSTCKAANFGLLQRAQSKSKSPRFCPQTTTTITRRQPDPVHGRWFCVSTRLQPIAFPSAARNAATLWPIGDIPALLLTLNACDRLGTLMQDAGLCVKRQRHRTVFGINVLVGQLVGGATKLCLGAWPLSCSDVA
jgi:hypothetical protein